MNALPSEECFRWNDETVERLRVLAGEGKSAAQIGDEMGASRNTIIGKASRCGVALTHKQHPNGPRLSLPANLRPSVPRSIALRSTVPKSRVGQHPKRNRAPVVERYVEKSAPVEAFGLVTIEALKDGVCHFPYGDPRDLETFRYCGVPVGVERYCAGHRRVMYRPRPVRKEARN